MIQSIQNSSNIWCEQKMGGVNIFQKSEHICISRNLAVTLSKTVTNRYTKFGLSNYIQCWVTYYSETNIATRGNCPKGGVSKYGNPPQSAECFHHSRCSTLPCYLRRDYPFSAPANSREGVLCALPWLGDVSDRCEIS